MIDITRQTRGKATGSPGQYSRPGKGKNLIWPVIFIGIAVLFIVSAPVSAGEQYMAGSPVLSASISGTNEFTAGKDVQLAIAVENTGLNQFKFVKTGLVSPEDLPNTAKFLTVTLTAGDTPFIIKSDPQMLGDLKASSKATGTFTIRIPTDAKSGDYILPVHLNYTYLYAADQYGTDTIEYRYKIKDEIVEVPIRIKPDVQIDVLSSKVEDLNAGMEGSIRLEVKNTGHENGKKAILIIAQNDGSPVIPTEPSAYIGDFPSGGTAAAVFKASASESAEAQTYPIDVYVKYENQDGDTLTTETETIGVSVGKKTEFTVVSEPEPVTPGSKPVITIAYKNNGDAVARQAQARISMVDPFSSNDDSAYLGDIAPGETKTASYLISVDKSATIKEYGIDSEVQYRDAFDNQLTSDPIKISLEVTEGTSFVSKMMSNPLALAGIAIIVLVIGYILYRKRNENR